MPWLPRPSSSSSSSRSFPPEGLSPEPLSRSRPQRRAGSRRLHGQGGERPERDGDADDRVLHALSTSGSVLNLLTAARMGPCNERLVTFVVEEEDQGADFNFDGDLDDHVLGVYDGLLDVFRNLAFATDVQVADVVEGAKVLFRARESEQGGQDLNGDGNAVTGVGLAIRDENIFSSFPRDPDVEGDLVTVPVFEAEQGGVDLNGDGDTMDSVLHLVELP